MGGLEGGDSWLCGAREGRGKTCREWLVMFVGRIVDTSPGPIHLRVSD